jgi:antitoxin (DNA-binding transcriptional repressor) of toxin-antitoxin stability system
MEDVKKYRIPVVITKKGRPVAKLVPPDSLTTDVFGCMAGTARIVGDVEGPVVPAEAWDVMSSRSPRRKGKRARSPRPPR